MTAVYPEAHRKRKYKARSDGPLHPPAPASGREKAEGENPQVERSEIPIYRGRGRGILLINGEANTCGFCCTHPYT